MTEPTHTPLPWTFEAGVEDNEGEFYVCHAGTVCTETTVCNPHSEADARFIVQAVNSHHRLVEALKTARDYVSDASRGHLTYEGSGEGFIGMAKEDLERIDAALKETGR